MVPLQAITSRNKGGGISRFARKTSSPHVGAIFTHCTGNDFTEIGILPRKFWYRRKSQPQQIVDNQNLPVAFRARTDANRRDAQLARDQRGKLPRNSF